MYSLTGHSPHFEVKEGDLSEDENILLTNVPGRPSSKSYVFAQLHVHVGREADKGSEHSINDRFYPMEVILQHFDIEEVIILQTRRQIIILIL
jgi:carbonic anhydrase